MSAIYGLSAKARAMDCVKGDTENVKFIVGTMALNDDNEVHVLRVEETEDERLEIREEGIFAHAGEIHDIETSSDDPNLFTTTFNQIIGSVPHTRSALWKITSHDSTEMVFKVDPTEGQNMLKLSWVPESQNDFIAFEDHSVRRIKVDNGDVTTTSVHPQTNRIHCGASATLHPSVVGVGCGSDIIGVDTRMKEPAFTFRGVPFGCVRSLSFNPYRLHYLCSGGDDCALKIWDCRATSQPVTSLREHRHWLECVRYHPAHDELVISAGAGGDVMLWSVGSASSAALEDTAKAQQQDKIIKRYEEHEESVYSAVWGSTLVGGRWVFASLSYDGRIVINEIPKECSELAEY